MPLSRLVNWLRAAVGGAWPVLVLGLLFLALVSTITPAAAQSLSLTISDVAVPEGNSGISYAVFNVGLSQLSVQTVSVSYATSPGTALAGNDYLSTNGVVSFPPGTTNQIIQVAILGDTNLEPNETFYVNLSNPTNAVISRAQGQGTILDDETRTFVFTNSSSIITPPFGPAAPFPSAIDLSNLPGLIGKLTVTLINVTHTYPDDFDILLVGPAGQNLLLMSDAGGSSGVNGITLTFDDSAASSLPDSSQLTSGTFKPTNYGFGDTFTNPAPVGPYGSTLSAFNGTNPNGTWSLYVYDDTVNDSGRLAGGWRLSLTLTNLTPPSPGTDADLAATVTDSPDPIVIGNAVTYSGLVFNRGPATASGVTVTNLLPAGVTFVSANCSQGTCTQAAGIVTCNLGSISAGTSARVAFTVNAPTAGLLTNAMSVAGNETDLQPANNSAVAMTTVNPPVPALSISDISVNEGNVGTTSAVFTVSLLPASAQTVSVDYSTADGTALAASDYFAASGTLVFAPGVTNQTISVLINGDVNIEGNETFFVNLTNSGTTPIAISQGTGTILNDDGLPGQIDHFLWSTASGTQYVASAFATTVTAKDAANNTATNFSGSASFSALAGAGPVLSILISEIDPGPTDAVELANVSSSTLDLSRWQISVYDALSWPDPEFTFIIPPGSLCGPGEIFVLQKDGSSPGAYPNFFAGAGIYWSNDSINNPMAVLLQDNTGRLVDFVCAVDSDPTLISNPMAIPSSEWTTLPLAANTNTAFSYSRIGNLDQNGSADWTAGPKSMGALNPGLSIPFLGNIPLPITPAGPVIFSAGVWSGNIAVQQPGTNVHLRADDGNGHTGAGNYFTVNPAADLAVTIASSPTPVNIGQALTCTVMVSNLGPNKAQSVVLTNTFPVSASFISATTSQGTFVRSGNVITCSFGDISNAAGASLNLQLSFSSAGPATNTARVTSATMDLISGNNLASQPLAINARPTISDILNRSVPEDTPAGPIPFTIGDVETAASSLVVSATSSNQVLVPNATILLAGSGSNRTVTLFPATNQFGVTLVTVTVIDLNGASASDTFLLTVTAVNDPPVLNAIAGQTIFAGDTLSLTASATDPDTTDTLTFSLGSGAPAGASIGPATGVFTWASPSTQALGAYPISVLVRDNGTPSLSATQSFSIQVLAPVTGFAITAGATNVLAGQTSSVPITLLSAAGLTNITFRLTGSEAYLTNFVIDPVVPQLDPSSASVQRVGLDQFAANLNAVANQSLQGTGQIARLRFCGLSNHLSTILPLCLTNVAGRRSNGVSLPNATGNDSRIVFIGDQPLLEAKVTPPSARFLMLYGRPGTSYKVEVKADPSQASWDLVTTVSMTNTCQRIDLSGQPAPVLLYRASETAPP